MTVKWSAVTIENHQRLHRRLPPADQAAPRAKLKSAASAQARSDTLLVKVETDAGLIGLGEAFPASGLARRAVALVETAESRARLHRRDPTDILRADEPPVAPHLRRPAAAGPA